jgi:hypothetical protein
MAKDCAGPAKRACGALSPFPFRFLCMRADLPCCFPMYCCKASVGNVAHVANVRARETPASRASSRFATFGPPSALRVHAK